MNKICNEEWGAKYVWCDRHIMRFVRWKRNKENGFWWPWEAAFTLLILCLTTFAVDRAERARQSGSLPWLVANQAQSWQPPWSQWAFPLSACVCARGLPLTTGSVHLVYSLYPLPGSFMWVFSLLAAMSIHCGHCLVLECFLSQWALVIYSSLPNDLTLDNHECASCVYGNYVATPYQWKTIYRLHACVWLVFENLVSLMFRDFVSVNAERSLK